MAAEDWKVRPIASADDAQVTGELILDMAGNSYLHGVRGPDVADAAGRIMRRVWQHQLFCNVVVTGDDVDVAGWVLFEKIPSLTVVQAYVEPSYRGLGAWRALRASIGLQDGQLVGCVLQGPKAMLAARKKYQAKHNWGRVVGWLL